MTQNRRIPCRFPLLTLALLAAPAVSHAQYQVFDLGVLTGGTTSKVYNINNAGYISGTSTVSGGTHAVLINGNLATPSLSNGLDLGTTGGLNSTGYALNNNNIVVGNSSTSTVAGSPLRAAYFDPNSTPVAHDAGVSTGMTGALRGVNDTGFAVGASNTGSTAVSYQVGSGATSLTSLAPLLGNPAVSTAYNVNNSGQIVGYYGSSAGSNQVFRLDTANNNTLVPLGTLGGVSATSDPQGGGYGINASGFIAGYAKTSTGALHAFLYDGVTDPTTGLKLHDLGVFNGSNSPNSTSGSGSSEAYSINSSGFVVGGSNIGTVASNLVINYHAFLYAPNGAFNTGAGLVDLNSLVNLNGTGLASLNIAYGINDNGWITGTATTTGGVQHAFLLKTTATPAPSSALVMGMGLFGAGLALRRRRK